MNSDFSLAVRLVRILPTVLIGAVVGCSIASFGFRISPDYLPISVIVPLTWAFLLTRILRIVVPTSSDRPVKKHDNTDAAKVSKLGKILIITFALLLTIGAFGAISFLFSSGTFLLLGLHSLGIGSVKIAAFLGILAIVSLFAIALVALVQISIINSDKLTVWVWKFLSLPRKLADYFPEIGKHHITLR
jgi:hypothetical protein